MKRCTILPLIGMLVFLFMPIAAQSSDETLSAKQRCPVCGMFVAKYPQWLARLIVQNGERLYFDGVKDMMAYYFAPEDFGAAAGQIVSKVEVKDYYSQKWIDGKNAWFVAGSDVLGPMGHELVPFSSEAAAQNFLQDHLGREILSFSSIKSERITTMRQGHKMKMMKKD